jgi:pimeloyl-ACP methyl ester carboxylesterase
MKLLFVKFCLVVALLMMASSALPQTSSRAAEGTPVATAQAAEGQKVKIAASDGIQIAGVFYPMSSKAPAVVLLHDGVSTKTQWQPYVATFAQAGYNVLIYDQRGSGDTPRSQTPGDLGTTGEKDVLTVVAWLRQQSSVDPDAVALIGARLGANFAIRACALDDQCHTVVALTPSTDFFGVKTEDAFKSMKKDKNVFLVATEFGESGSKSLKALTADSANEINLMVRQYGLGFESGPAMIDKDPNLMPMILLWLKSYNHS